MLRTPSWQEAFADGFASIAPTTIGGREGFLATISGFDCSFSFQGVSASEEAFKRLLGCMAFVHMPAEALNETLCDVRDNFEFHSRRAELLSVLPISKRGQGTLVKKNVGPSLVGQ